MQLLGNERTEQAVFPLVWETQLRIYSRGAFFSQNLTQDVQHVVEETALLHGEVVLLGQHTTSAVMLIEYEAGVLLDLKRTLEEMTPPEDSYAHHIRDVDRNGRAHVLGALFNRSVVVPVRAGKLVLGKYQDIAFMDFQEQIKPRSINLRITGARRA